MTTSHFFFFPAVGGYATAVVKASGGWQSTPLTSTDAFLSTIIMALCAIYYAIREGQGR